MASRQVESNCQCSTKGRCRGLPGVPMLAGLQTDPSVQGLLIKLLYISSRDAMAKRMGSVDKRNQQLAARMSGIVECSVLESIEKGRIRLGQGNEEPVGSRLGKVANSKLYEVLKKRKQLQEEIERLRYDEKKLKQSQPKLMSSHGSSKFRSELTSEEKKSLLKLLQATKQFEEQSKRKTLQLASKIKEQIELQKKIEQATQKTRRENIRQEIDKKLMELEERKRQRLQQMERTNQQLRKVHGSKFLYQKIQQRIKAEDQIKAEEMRKFFEENRQTKRYRKQQIQEHQKYYKQKVEEQKRKRDLKMSRLREQLQQMSRISQYGESRLLKVLQEEQKQKKQKLLQKSREFEELGEKRMNYAEYLRQRHKSELKIQKNTQAVPQTHLKMRKSLDFTSLNNLGNTYMKQIHKKIDNHSPGPKKSHSLHKFPALESKQTQKYHDYLTTARSSREIQNPEKPAAQLLQLKKIMNLRAEPKNTRISKARTVIQRMDQKCQKNTQALISSIKAKLDLIDQLALN